MTHTQSQQHLWRKFTVQSSREQTSNQSLQLRFVAIKLQFPFLKVQSKYDLIVLKKIILFCNYLMEKKNYKDIDLIKLYETFTSTLVEELDFRTEVNNAQRTK